MPGGFSTVSHWEKSGNWRYRISFSGKIVLQLEERQKTGWVDGVSTQWNGVNKRWRDAKQTDMNTVVEIRYQ